MMQSSLARISRPLLAVLIIILSKYALIAAEPALPTKVEFNRDIRPILSDKCFFCHGPDAKKREADLRLDLRNVAVESGAIAPGKPDESELVRRILSDDPDEHMPPASSKLERLSERDVQLLRQWISQGAEYQNHWSFIPPGPVVTESGAAPSVDELVREGLAARSLRPQPEADRPTLLRRLSFDLTGLPPTPAELAAFIADSSPDAYERLVERLLSSEHFGERMAVDWLDAARYADSYGFQVDRERETWPWRDWVVRAFNSNLPFDQFITWQIAGDLLPDATDDQILATAFNRLHQQETEGGSVEEEYRVEYVSDRVQTFATAFLGLTFECCRCHDHKYDPITQREYYQLFAMFQNIDEAGLYSYFTPSVPTPTLQLADDTAKRRLSELRHAVEEMEQKRGPLRASRQSAFVAWLAEQASSSQSPPATHPKKRDEDRTAAMREIGRFTFDKLEASKLANSVKPNQPATLRGENKLVPGREGSAIEFTGDDPVDLPIGNFQRQQPLSISLWLKTPNEKDRAVVFHRSRAWTDAGSRGYELLIENGKLKWSLIHFWPGNAISIAARDKLPMNEWVHVLVTSDGSSRADGLQIFVNGRPALVEIEKDHLTKEITGGGGDNIALGERFRDRGFHGGQIDDFRVFERELTPFEALAIFDEAAAQALLAKGLAGAEEAAGSKDRDILCDFYLAAADAEWSKYLHELQSARGELAKFSDGMKEIMVMRELPAPKKAYVLLRGEYAQRREEVQAGTPASLLPFPEHAPRNRLGLAQWLTDRRHPLTARVTVNRVWQSLFGSGLVKTAEDFGSQGSRPRYPKVLDWLALKFIDSGWDFKQLVKTIVLSQTYRQRSLADPKTMTDDPENEWLARGPRFRLPAEMIRDNALTVAGLLNRQLGGPPVNPYEMSESFKPATPSDGDGVYRRSIYTNWRRTGPPPAMVAFDAPRRAVCIAKRERTDSPLQALILLNGVQYVEAARVLGASLHRDAKGDLSAMIEQAFLRCLSRQPDAREVEIVSQLYREQLEHFRQHPNDAEELLKIGHAPRDTTLAAPESAAATILAQAVLNHDSCVMKQ